MSTQEIAKAIKNLSIDTLKSSLAVVKASTTGNKEKLEQEYQSSVLEVGISNLIQKLNESDLPQVCEIVGVPHESRPSSEIRTDLEKAVIGLGITGLCDKASEDLLKKFSDTLALESAEKEDMKKQIADEVMLTGMEGFLNKLSLQLLKSYVSELGLPSTGKKKEIVERLMVHIFELEPLAASTEDKEEKPQDTKKKSKEKKEKEKKEPKKREKFVAPPLDTIAKGKYDTYVALYDNFNLPDLVNYCKKHNLKTSGKKKEVIQRILHYLNTGETATPSKSPKKRKKGAAASNGKSPKKAKKSETSASTSESKDSKKSESDSKDS